MVKPVQHGRQGIQRDAPLLDIGQQLALERLGKRVRAELVCALKVLHSGRLRCYMCLMRKSIKENQNGYQSCDAGRMVYCLDQLLVWHKARALDDGLHLFDVAIDRSQTDSQVVDARDRIEKPLDARHGALVEDVGTLLRSAMGGSGTCGKGEETCTEHKVTMIKRASWALVMGWPATRLPCTDWP